MFVVQGDITDICCDVLLIPVNAAGQGWRKEDLLTSPFHKRWLETYAKRKLASVCAMPSSSSAASTPTRSWFDFLSPKDIPKVKTTKYSRIFHLQHNQTNYPSIFALNVVPNTAETVEERLLWQMKGLKQFLSLVKGFLQDAPPAKRGKYLVSVPVIGSGGGGGMRQTGRILREILQITTDFTSKQDKIDIVVCTFDRPTLIIAQKIRLEQKEHYFRSLMADPIFSFPPPFTSVFEFTKHLATQLENDKLVLFLGRDANRCTGILSQEDLMDKIAVMCGIHTGTASWKNSDLLSRADIIHARCQRKQLNFQELIAAEQAFPQCSLLNLLVAGLNFSGVVTTNYETTYEHTFAKVQKKTLNVIPVKIAKDSKNWLLKLNGCVSVHDTIVATRKDTLRYMEGNAALAGIVQAKLLTSHMLFIGFSLDDNTFHQVIDSVSKATVNEVRCIGTTVQPFHNLYSGELWSPLIECTAMTEAPKDTMISERMQMESFRKIEIFMDLLFLQSVAFNTEYILDHRFNEILDPKELILKERLNSLAEKLRGENFTDRSIFTNLPVIANTLTSYGKHVTPTLSYSMAT